MTLQERYSILLDKCVSSLTIWRNIINENLEDADRDTQTEKLKQIAKEYCAIDIDHKKSENAIALLDEAVSDPSKTYNVDDIYKEKFAEQDTEDVTDNEIWQQLFCNNLSIQEVKPKKRKENTQYEEVDDSLMLSNSFTAPLDPISKVVIRQPIRNRKCKHIYDKNSIYDYIRQSRKRAKCPYMGCSNNNLIPSDLQDDKQLEEQITQYLASQDSEDDSD